MLCVCVFFSSKTYDKIDDFDFPTLNFPFLDGDVPLLYISYGVYILQLPGIAIRRLIFLLSLESNDTSQTYLHA